MKSLAEEARDILQEYVDEEHQGIKSRAAMALGLSNITLGQWLNGTRIPNLEALSPVFAKLGVTFSLPSYKAGQGIDSENFFDSAVAAIRQAIDSDYKGNVSQAARALGISVPTLHTWMKGDRKPSLEKLSPILDLLGAKITLPSREPDRDVCFVNARVVPAGEGIEPPQAEDYIAAPMVGGVGAGPDHVRRNLLAVEIGRDSDSMQPTLNPGDIVLVDRDDRNVQHAGHMMLVLDPDGNGMIKRVSVEDQPDGDSRITFYSDNAVRHAPRVFSLREDYLGDWERAIVGRVIWAWADVREK